MIKDVLFNILQAVIVIAIPVIVAEVRNWLKSKIALIDDEKWLEILRLIDSTIEEAVAQTQVTMVEDYKKSGTFGKAVQVKALLNAYELTKQTLPKDVLQECMDRKVNLETLLKNKIEEQVIQNKLIYKNSNIGA